MSDATPALRPEAGPPALPQPMRSARTPADAALRWSAGGYMSLGVVVVAILVFGLGGWSAFASISGAVVSSGRLKVESERQVVQHLEGGVVAEILVQEGDVVQAGDILVRLDGARARAELGIVESQLFEAMARIGRLEAEQVDADEIVYDPELLEMAAARPEVASLVEGQTGLFNARNDTVRRETEQLRERQAQIEEEIEGSHAQRESLEIQLSFIEQELGDLRSLLERGLAQASRVLSLEREKARLIGQTGALTAQIAQARGRITEIDIQLNGLTAERREQAITELRDLKSREAELKERRLAALDVLDRLDIRAPRSGVVLEMTVFAIRSVVRPAEPLLYIVPLEEALVVEARVEPVNVDQVYPGQSARLRFSAFNQRTTPEIEAVIARISPDAIVDETTGLSFYTAEVVIPDEQLARLGELTLVAGMPVEVFIQTGDRSPMSYLMKPVTDFFSKSMREE